MLESNKIPSSKDQITNKFQYQMTETSLVRRRRIGHCDLLFGIFGHSISPKLKGQHALWGVKNFAKAS
jgi:hypothetical protein